MTQTAPDRVFRVATLQPALRFGRVMPNLHLIRQTVEKVVAEAPLDLVVLPELFDGDPDDSSPSRVGQFLGTLARRCDTHVIGGSSLIVDEQGRRFNTCFVFDRHGEEVGRYDKRILFSTEADRRQPGESAGVFELDSFRVGVLICADLWHPELARALCNQVDILAVPVKTTVPSEKNVEYARTLWQSMALTRAMENGLAVLVSDWCSARHDWSRQVQGSRLRQTHYTSGAACIVDPSHRPDVQRIHRTLARGEEGVLRADIKLAALATFREYRQSVGLLPSEESW